jgi:hypothetical protein
VKTALRDCPFGLLAVTVVRIHLLGRGGLDSLMLPAWYPIHAAGNRYGRPGAIA